MSERTPDRSTSGLRRMTVTCPKGCAYTSRSDGKTFVALTHCPYCGAEMVEVAPWPAWSGANGGHPERQP